MWRSRVVATCKGRADGLRSAPATVSDAASTQDALWRHQALSTSPGCLVNLTNDDLHEVLRCRRDDMLPGASEVGPAQARIVHPGGRYLLVSDAQDLWTRRVADVRERVFASRRWRLTDFIRRLD